MADGFPMDGFPPLDNSSNDMDELINYVLTTPDNTNPNVLKSMLEDEGVYSDELFNYLINTPENINPNVLRSMLTSNVPALPIDFPKTGDITIN